MFTPIRKMARALRVPSVAEREMNYLNGARDLVAVRQKPLIGFVGERPVAVELQFVEDVVGR